jgi:hypothetical protein
VGGVQLIIESEGEESVAAKIRAAAEPFRTADGGYRFVNKYLMSVFRKNEIPRKQKSGRGEDLVARRGEGRRA